MNMVVSHWSANVAALAAYAVAAAVHLLGVRGAAAVAGRRGADRPAEEQARLERDGLPRQPLSVAGPGPQSDDPHT